MREESDSRTTLDKISGLRGDLRILLNLARLGGGMVDDSVIKPESVDSRAASVFNLIDMIEEEVEIMIKCQYEMRKTIKSKTYIVADNQPMEEDR